MHVWGCCFIIPGVAYLYAFANNDTQKNTRQFSLSSFTHVFRQSTTLCRMFRESLLCQIQDISLLIALWLRDPSSWVTTNFTPFTCLSHFTTWHNGRTNELTELTLYNIHSWKKKKAYGEKLSSIPRLATRGLSTTWSVAKLAKLAIRLRHKAIAFITQLWRLCVYSWLLSFEKQPSLLP